MEVQYAMLAAAAQMTPDGGVSMLNGGVDNLIGHFPGLMPLPLYVPVRVAFQPNECGREYELAVEIITPGGAQLLRGSARATPTPPQPPKRVGTITSLLVFAGVSFPELGLYTLRILVDNQALMTIDFLVSPVPEEAGR